jgi:hypothetical protein
MKVNPSTPRPAGQGLPSTRAQAEGLRVDPEARFLTPSLKTGLGAAERVKIEMVRTKKTLINDSLICFSLENQFPIHRNEDILFQDIRGIDASSYPNIPC